MSEHEFQMNFKKILFGLIIDEKKQETGFQVALRQLIDFTKYFPSQSRLIFNIF